MSKVAFGTEYDDAINAHAQAGATAMRRGAANIEDQFRSALALLDGLGVIDKAAEKRLKEAINAQMSTFLGSLLQMESEITAGSDPTSKLEAQGFLQSFLLCFASRAASRERLHVSTTNYDRLIEYGCDYAGLRIIDRFVGALNPMFRASRIEVDVHYNPPGIRGEPRFMEGVIRLTKLHGSLDWFFNHSERRIYRKGIPFGAPKDHTDVPRSPIDTVMIYPNPERISKQHNIPMRNCFTTSLRRLVVPTQSL